jgi:hypothetical protein
LVVTVKEIRNGICACCSKQMHCYVVDIPKLMLVDCLICARDLERQVRLLGPAAAPVAAGMAGTPGARGTNHGDQGES